MKNLKIFQLVLSIFLISSISVFAQSKSTSEIGMETTLYTMGGANNVKGTLLDFDDSSIMFQTKNNSPATVLPITHINYMEIKKGRRQSRMGSVVKGAFFGGAIGAALGGLIYYMSYEDNLFFSRGNSVIIGAISGGPLGFAAGGVLGGLSYTPKLKIPIHGSQRNFDLQKEKIRQLGL